MNRSEEIVDLISALSKAQGEFGVAVHDKKNPHFKNSYASLQSVHDAIREPMAKHGLAVAHLVSNHKMSTTLFHASGQWIACDLDLPQGLTPQQLGSALTYYRRYSLCCLLALPSGEEDDDGCKAEVAFKAAPKQVECISKSQAEDIERLIGDDMERLNKLLKWFKVDRLSLLPSTEYGPIMARLNAKKEAHTEETLS
jgi:ERF superfamily protein